MTTAPDSGHADMLALLLDEREIAGLQRLYCRALDRGDGELLRTIYHADALIEHARFRGDVDTFLRFVLPKMAAIDHSSHHVTGISIEIDGDRAFCETAFINIASDPDRRDPHGRPYDRQLTGRYLDRLERGPSGWKIRHRQVIYDTNQLLVPVGPQEDPRFDSFHPRGVRGADDPSVSARAEFRAGASGKP